MCAYSTLACESPGATPAPGVPEARMLGRLSCAADYLGVWNK